MLAGNLDEFSLTDVLRFLSQTGKSGELRVDAGGSSGRIDLQHGQVAGATADAARLPLAARLLDGGMVEEEHLVRAVDDGTEVPGWLARSLLAQEVLDAEALDAVVADSTRDAVAALLRHQQGTFAFRVLAPADVLMPGALEVDRLVADCRERADRWAVMREHLPADDTVLVPASEPGDGGEIVLTVAQWRVLGLVDGRRTVLELLELGGSDQESTCGVIADLVRAGLLVPAGEAAHEGAGLAGVLHRREVVRRLERRVLGPEAATPLPPVMPQVPPLLEPTVPAPSLSAVAPPEPITLDPELVASLAAELGGDHDDDEPEAPRAEEATANVPEPAHVPAPVPAPATPAAPILAPGTVDRSQAVRELAALGLSAPVGDLPTGGGLSATSAAAGEVQQRRGFGRLLGT